MPLYLIARNSAQQITKFKNIFREAGNDSTSDSNSTSVSIATFSAVDLSLEAILFNVEVCSEWVCTLDSKPFSVDLLVDLSRKW